MQRRNYYQQKHTALVGTNVALRDPDLYVRQGTRDMSIASLALIDPGGGGCLRQIIRASKTAQNQHSLSEYDDSSLTNFVSEYETF
jgi:hypothetical protein